MKTLLSKEYKEARQKYLSILNQKKVRLAHFFSLMTNLIDLCPHFLPPHLEILENLEGHCLTFDYRNFLKISTSIIISTYASTTTQCARDNLAQMDYHETHALYWLIRRITGDKRNIASRKFFDFYRLARLSNIVDDVYTLLQPFTTEASLRCIDRNISVAETLKILKTKEHYWYEWIDRQEAIYNHRATQTIVLRKLLRFEEYPVAVDGNHESVITEKGKVFHNLLHLIENFAETQHAGLGRVVLVRLCPKSVVYRHYDAEKQLVGRTRFHLVLECKPGNILMSGVDFAKVSPGELWLYGNKVLHRSINDSNDWRTHVIFDMYDIATHAQQPQKEVP